MRTSAKEDWGEGGRGREKQESKEKEKNKGAKTGKLETGNSSQENQQEGREGIYGRVFDPFVGRKVN